MFCQQPKSSEIQHCCEHIPSKRPSVWDGLILQKAREMVQSSGVSNRTNPNINFTHPISTPVGLLLSLQIVLPYRTPHMKRQYKLEKMGAVLMPKHVGSGLPHSHLLLMLRLNPYRQAGREPVTQSYQTADFLSPTQFILVNI